MKKSSLQQHDTKLVYLIYNNVMWSSTLILPIMPLGLNIAPPRGHYRTLTLLHDFFKQTKMADKRIHNPDKSYSADVSRISRSHDQDGHHTHIW